MIDYMSINVLRLEHSRKGICGGVVLKERLFSCKKKS